MRTLLARQQVRFLLAGAVNTGLDFLLLNALTLAFGLPTLLANSITVTIGITISYLLNHFFVFRHPEPISFARYAKFFAVTGFSSLVLQNVIIFLFELLFESQFGNSLLLFAGPQGQRVIELNVAKATAVLIGLIWNYSFYRLVVFRRPAAAPGAGHDQADAGTRLD